MAAEALMVLMLMTGSMFLLVSTQDAIVQFVIWEDRPNKTYVGSVALESQLFSTAVNNESYQNLQFAILHQGGEYEQLFYIDSTTSIVRTNRVLDREDFDECTSTCILDFQVAVYRDDFTDLFKFIEVQVFLEDLNDNAPVFQQTEMNIEVLESKKTGYVVFTDFAEDLDKGNNNSVQSYQLVPQSDIFEIEVSDSDHQPLEFSLILKDTLDRENVNFYQFVVLARDGGLPQKTGTLSLYITVLDSNDNKPVFTKPQYNRTVKENIDNGSSILLLTATDIDEGDNARIMYKFNNRVSSKVSQHFSINETTGELTLIELLDYETDQQFEFTVEAHDHGTPSLSSDTKVFIKISDVNDNYPKININIPPRGSVISEQAEVDTFITHLEVTDRDAGNNGKISCSTSDIHFRLDEVELANNYKLVLNMSLNHEISQIHRVNISCHDNGTPVRHNSTIFVVYVEDVNDNYPIFDQQIYEVKIVENNEEITPVVFVSATDADSGRYGQVEYSLHSEVSDLFTVNSFTGLISTNGSLDRETNDEFIFRVFASDKGYPVLTSTGTVVVTVLDENDNDPIFLVNPFIFNVTENQPYGSYVGNVSAHDPDNGENGTFHFSFLEEEEFAKYFEFKSDGQITTLKSLDRENLSLHEFHIYAVDLGGRTSSVLVTVTVNDLNDNIPAIFYPNNYDKKKLIPHNLSVGSVVATIDARDEDLGINAELSYFVDQDNSSYLFRINEDTGDIILNNSLNMEYVGMTFSLVIRVKDHGSPPLQSWANFHIGVILGEEESSEKISKLQLNFWIVIIVVVVTAIIAMVIIGVICKLCWFDRRTDSDKTSDIIVVSDPVNPKLIESSLSSTESDSFNEKQVVKLPDVSLNQDENSMFNTTFSSDEKHAVEQMYLEKVGELGYSYGKKGDEANSDNSGELGTRDSGQGGSDIDLNSLNEHPDTDLDINSGSRTPDNNLYGRGIIPSPRDINHGSTSPRDSYYGDILNCSHNSDSTDSTFRKQVADFKITPFKTAERKEIVKIRKVPKRVMFSDDLENSQSSTSSGVSFSYSDINNMINQLQQAPRRHRLSSDETSSSTDFHRPSDNFHRSVDNLPLLSRLYHNKTVHSNRQLPSNRLVPSNHLLQVSRGTKGQGHRTNRVFKDSGPFSSSSEGDRNSVEVYSLSTDNSKCSESRDDVSTSTSGSYSLTLDESWAGVPSAVYDKDVYV